jgi:hypothetical protein
MAAVPSTTFHLLYIMHGTLQYCLGALTYFYIALNYSQLLYFTLPSVLVLLYWTQLQPTVTVSLRQYIVNLRSLSVLGTNCVHN